MSHANTDYRKKHKRNDYDQEEGYNAKEHHYKKVNSKVLLNKIRHGDDIEEDDFLES